MAESARILKVGVRHEAILNYLVANPNTPMSAVAREFGVSQPWLSTIIHSDAFQARLRERQEAMFSHHVLPLGEKLLGLAHIAVERIGQQLDTCIDPEHTLEVTKTLLDRVGFSPKQHAAPAHVNVQQNNYYQVDKDTLEEARNAIGRRLGGAPASIEDATEVEGEFVPRLTSPD